MTICSFHPNPMNRADRRRFSRLRFITDPGSPGVAPTPIPRAPRLTTQASAARYFQVHERTIFRWIDVGHITGYRDGRDVLVDLDEIEHALATRSDMRDGRRARFSERATIVPAPVSASKAEG